MSSRPDFSSAFRFGPWLALCCALTLMQCASAPRPTPTATLPAGPSAPPPQSAAPVIEGPGTTPSATPAATPTATAAASAVPSAPAPTTTPSTTTTPPPNATAAPTAGTTPIATPTAGATTAAPPTAAEEKPQFSDETPGGGAVGEENVGREPLPLETEGEAVREAALARKRLLEQARLFDRYVHGQLDDAQIASVIASCRRRSAGNPFCFSYKRRRLLDARIAARRRVYQPPPPRVYEPIPAVMSGGIATNWTELRKGEVRSVIKGISSLSPTDLAALATQALEEKRCPNRAAVAIAATLEDSLPNPELYDTISRLYEAGAHCARREPVDQEHFRTRAALYRYLRGDYGGAAELLARVRPTDAYSGRATYWLYRSYRSLGDGERAERALKKLLRLHALSFHTLIAQLSEGLDPGTRFLGDKKHLKEKSRRSAVNQFIAQAELLRRAGFSDTAALIADWALEGRWHAEGEVRLYLASLGDAHTRVMSLPPLLLARPQLASRQTMELMYPTTFRATMERHAEGVDPFLLLALARKESAFDPKAVSIANAQGLLQLNPETAKKTLEALNPGASLPDLLDPEVNASIAARHVAELLGKLSGKLHLAIAAYNAGDAPVQTWQRRNPIDDVVLFIDLIPYRETRDYTAGVLANYYWYRRLYGGGMPEGLRVIVPATARK